MITSTISFLNLWPEYRSVGFRIRKVSLFLFWNLLMILLSKMISQKNPSYRILTDDPVDTTNTDILETRLIASWLSNTFNNHYYFWIFLLLLTYLLVLTVILLEWILPLLYLLVFYNVSFAYLALVYYSTSVSSLALPLDFIVVFALFCLNLGFFFIDILYASLDEAVASMAAVDTDDFDYFW